MYTHLLLTLGFLRHEYTLSLETSVVRNVQMCVFTFSYNTITQCQRKCDTFLQVYLLHEDT